MRVLVTGGAGFIGSHIVDALLARGHAVRILDSLEPPVHRDRARPAYLAPEAEFQLGDVRSRDDLGRALDGVEAVYHLAAYQDYLTDFSRFIHVNTFSTALLYELAVARKLDLAKIVLASSQATYGEGRYRCPLHGVQYPDSRPLEQLEHHDWELRCPQCGEPMAPEASEEPVIRPHNSYAISKHGLEQVSLALGRRYNIPTVCLRYSIIQGPRQSFRNAYSGVCRIFTLRLLNGHAPLVYEDGKQLRDYTWVGDCVEASLLVLERPEADYQVFNVGSGRTCTVLEYSGLVAKELGSPLEPEVPGHFRLGDTRHVFSDVSRLQALGWQPTTPLEEIVKRYVGWGREHPAPRRDYSTEADAEMRRQGTVRGT